MNEDQARRRGLRFFCAIHPDWHNTGVVLDRQVIDRVAVQALGRLQLPLHDIACAE